MLDPRRRAGAGEQWQRRDIGLHVERTHDDHPEVGGPRHQRERVDVEADVDDRLRDGHLGGAGAVGVEEGGEEAVRAVRAR